MYEVIEIKGKTATTAGVTNYEAEATLKKEDGTIVYANAGEYTGLRAYTVTDKSIIDFMTGNGDDPNAKTIADYEELEDARDGEYGKVYEVLDAMVTLMVVND